MLQIFRTLVTLYGYPGHFQEDWFSLVERGKSVLTTDEYNAARNWINIWSIPLRSMLGNLKSEET